MTNPHRSLPDPSESRDSELPSNLPVIINASELPLPPMDPAAHPLRFIDTPQPVADKALGAVGGALGRKKESMGGAVLRGIKDLQQLQKQTIAVLESVKGTLDDIQQVLRSPEATRGMEKQRNAAMLLAKGFAREAVEQAQGAVALLPANPESHLLLSLSLAADQQFDTSLAVARKGLALVDRRTHPLAIECGLLHALAALGCADEAVQRWSTIIEALPLPVLFEQMTRIAACFPGESLGGGEFLLDDMINRRLARDEQNPVNPETRRDRLRASGTVDLRPDEIPASTLFVGLDAAHEHHLPNTHRAVLAQIARRLQLVPSQIGGGGEVVKFISECVLPLGNRGLDRSAGALGRAAVKRLLKCHGDVMTLHRALVKLEMAGATVAAQEIAVLLNHWRLAGNKVARARRSLALSVGLLAGGVAALVNVMAFMNGGGALAGKGTMLAIGALRLDAVLIGPALLGLGGLVGLWALFGRTWHVALPEGRGPLTAEEIAVLNRPEVRESLRAALKMW